MTLRQPLPFTADVETIRPDEQNKVQGLIDAFDVILHRTSEDYPHAVRSVHAKGHGILLGQMVIDGGLAPELATISSIQRSTASRTAFAASKERAMCY